jgi:endonuclease G
MARKKSTSGKKAAARKPTKRRTKQAKDKDRMTDKLRRFVRTEGPRYLADDNISSIGVGYKIKNGKRTRQLCLQFTVRTKPEESGALPEGIDTRPIPEALDIGGEMIPTDVLERGFRPTFQLLDLEDVMEVADRKRRLDPIIPGISVSHPSGSAGTLGLVVFDRDTGDPCLLSNWHVLHLSQGKLGDGVVQPGPFDDNRSDDNHVGTLVRSHLGPAGDCAIARIEDREFETNILELGVTPARIARVELGDRVVKSGRTTGVTMGMVRRVDVMAKLHYDGVGEKIIGAFEYEPLDDAGPDFEISQGGDSGSAVLIAGKNGAPTDILAGLHFGGESGDNPDEHALACYAHSVFRKPRVSLTAPTAPEAIRQRGYDPGFLSETVPTPRLTRAIQDDAFQLDGSHLIRYTHFSVCQSKARALARFVAWNIDGNRLKSLNRRGINFRRDPRIPDRFQSGNELYSGNPLDRGHLARLADLTWGTSSEASRANRESFFYTNIAPQHQAFNQSKLGGLWGRLENAILSEVNVEDLRISVMAGPIFKDDDPEHRDVPIPRSYWKLVAYRDDDDSQFQIRAYILTQRNLLQDIEALELDPFRMFQVSLDKLREETGLNFSSLRRFDTLSTGRRAEALDVGVREVVDHGDVIV